MEHKDVLPDAQPGRPHEHGRGLQVHLLQPPHPRVGVRPQGRHNEEDVLPWLRGHLRDPRTAPDQSQTLHRHPPGTTGQDSPGTAGQVPPRTTGQGPTAPDQPGQDGRGEDLRVDLEEGRHPGHVWDLHRSRLQQRHQVHRVLN